MRKIRYRFQFSHFAVLTGLLALVLNGFRDSFHFSTILFSFFLALEISHNLFMLVGTPIIISGDKIEKRYWFLKKSLLISKDTTFTYKTLLGLSWGKEIMIIQTGNQKIRILDDFMVTVEELHDILLLSAKLT